MTYIYIYDMTQTNLKGRQSGWASRGFPFAFLMCRTKYKHCRIESGKLRDESRMSYQCFVPHCSVPLPPLDFLEQCIDSQVMSCEFTAGLQTTNCLPDK